MIVQRHPGLDLQMRGSIKLEIVFSNGKKYLFNEPIAYKIFKILSI